jgi:hypothetical protein
MQLVKSANSLVSLAPTRRKHQLPECSNTNWMEARISSGWKTLGDDIMCVGRLVVVIDVNPSHGFWTARLMKVFGHEGKCTCRYNTHGWIVYIMLFLVVCGMSRGSSWLRRNEFLKMTK